MCTVLTTHKTVLLIGCSWYRLLLHLLARKNVLLTSSFGVLLPQLPSWSAGIFSSLLWVPVGTLESFLLGVKRFVSILQCNIISILELIVSHTFLQIPPHMKQCYEILIFARKTFFICMNFSLSCTLSPFPHDVDECGFIYSNIHLFFIVFRSAVWVGEADAPTHLVLSTALGLIG